MNLDSDLKLTPSDARETLAAAGAGTDLHIPFAKFRLDNGLTVIVHENRRAPLVTLNLWYRVGSKDEPPGKTGFAHLFEHLMFGGSANFPGRFISNMTEAGASSLNGTTNRDRTNYFETVPTVALDYALFAESDRMGHFYETLSQETLDLQRGVVQNEKRQREGAPYGGVSERIVLGTYPPGHPYAHTVLGSMEDLEQASLDDARNWFRTYYGPSNAVLTLAGDIDAVTAREKVTQYFGHIPPGPPLVRPTQWIAKMSGTRREVLEDRVRQSKLYMVWNVPQYGDPDLSPLGLVGAVLTSGMSARLRKRLVYRDRLATSVSAGVSGGTLAGQFTISATVASDADIGAVERAIQEELARLIAEGPKQDEIDRARSRNLAGFVRTLDSVSGIADMLSMCEVRLGQPDFYRTDIARVRAATPDSVREAAARWLSDGVFILHVVPFPSLRAMGKGIDRSRVPAIAAPPGIRVRELQRATLSNGLRVILAERHELPLVQCSMQFEFGCVAESTGEFGLAQLTTTLMTAGSGERDALEFAAAKQDIGAELGVGSRFEWSTASLSAMKAQLGESLALYADLILRPRFDAADFERERARMLARIDNEINSPGGALSRVLPALLLPAGHPYARPMSGSGLKAHIAAATREQVLQFHARFVRPQLATLIVAGDVTLAEILPLLERHFGDWQRSDVWPVTIPLAPRPLSPAVYLIDKPDTPQAVVCAATLVEPISSVDAFPARVVNRVLGGEFGSRINMNLREDKHWTYGARSHWDRLSGPQFYKVQASVQIDKTAESMLEIRRELLDIVGARPVTAEELERSQRFDLLKLGGTAASLGGLADAIQSLVCKKLPDDYWERYADRVRAVTVDSVNEAARALIDPARTIWLVAGDLSHFESAVRALGFGPVVTLSGAPDEGYLKVL